MGEVIEMKKVETTTSFWDGIRAMDQTIRAGEPKKKKKAKRKVSKNNFDRR